MTTTLQDLQGNFLLNNKTEDKNTMSMVFILLLIKLEMNHLMNLKLFFMIDNYTEYALNKEKINSQKKQN